MRSLTNRPIRRAAAAVAAVAATVALLAGCSGPPTQQQQDAAASAQNTDRLIAKQPVAAGNYSPTRDTINAWNQTWQSAPGKRAYTYIYVGGAAVGYYVLTGPPVTYAQGATQPYRIDCNSNGCQQMPNPGQDGTFANQGTGSFQYYGKDATTGRILEWGGATTSYFLSDKPLPIPAPPLGDTK